MARARSSEELWRLSQYASDRVYQGRGGALSEAASEKAFKGAVNISKTKSYQRTLEKWQSPKLSTEEKAVLASKAFNRKYAASTYLGTANG